MQYSVSLYCEEQVKFDQKIKPKVTIKQSFQEFSFGYDEVRTLEIYVFLKRLATGPLPAAHARPLGLMRHLRRDETFKAGRDI